MLSITGDWDKAWPIPWWALGLLAAGGISHFVAGRLFVFSSIRLIGANKANIITRMNLFYAVAFGIIFLHEPFTAYLAAGVLLVAVGATLAGMAKGVEDQKMQVKGALIGLAGAFFWGISGVLIKPAIAEIGSSLAAAFISYLSALVVMAAFFLSRERRMQLSQLPRSFWLPFLIIGVTFSFGQLFRYIALGYSPVSVVNPLFSTTTIFTYLFSLLLNRRVEVFTWKVVLGMVLTVAGTYLLFQ